LARTFFAAAAHFGLGMPGEILVALLEQCGHAGLFANSRGGDFLGSHRVAPQHVAHALLLDLAQRVVKQCHLQDTAREQGIDLRFGDGGDVVKPALANSSIWPLLIIPRSPTKVTRWQPKRWLALRTCAPKVCGSWVLPRNTSVRDRRAVFVAQQADDDLFLAFLAVAVVAVGAEGVVLAFQISCW